MKIYADICSQKYVSGNNISTQGGSGFLLGKLNYRNYLSLFKKMTVYFFSGNNQI